MADARPPEYPRPGPSDPDRSDHPYRGAFHLADEGNRTIRAEQRAEKSPREVSPISPLKTKELRSLPYDQYLQTPHWRKLRHAKLHSVSWKCERCGTKGNLQVHHRTYERLGCERLDDLEVMCREHHEEFHFRESYERARSELAGAAIRSRTNPGDVGATSIDETPLTHEQALEIIQKLKLPTVPFRSIPTVRRIDPRKADRVRALRMVMAEIRESALRCAELEDEQCPSTSESSAK